jgi:hypothetical protein
MAAADTRPSSKLRKSGMLVHGKPLCTPPIHCDLEPALLPLQYLSPLRELWRRGHLEFGYWSFFGIWGLGFGASPGRFIESIFDCRHNQQMR